MRFLAASGVTAKIGTVAWLNRLFLAVSFPEKRLSRAGWAARWDSLSPV